MYVTYNLIKKIQLNPFKNFKKDFSTKEYQSNYVQAFCNKNKTNKSL